jgi:serine/threonine-protein kinase
MTSSPSVTGVREGDLLAGKYRIDRILGAGGMGVVVAAHHVHLEEKVAIKFLLTEMITSGEAVARFTREARAAVKIKSDHVVRVSDVGMLENGAPYMVMEYLEGEDLSGWIKKRGALSVEQSVEFLLQTCEAIAEAHTLGIIHRDLKPANLFVIRRPDGALSVKVLDFGISKMRGAGSSVPDVSITKTSAMMGSPLYMSPEQMQSAKDVDPRADIWAMGIILYELLTGEAPFVAESVPELVAKVLSVPPPSLRSKRSEAPEGLDAVIIKCLEKDPANRFESVAELAHALIPFAPRRSRLSIERVSGVMRAAGLPGGSTALPPSSDPTQPAPPGATQVAWGRPTVPRLGARTTLVAVVVVVLGTGAFVGFQRRSPRSIPEASPPAVFDPPPANNFRLPTPVAMPRSAPLATAPASSSARRVGPLTVAPAAAVPKGPSAARKREAKSAPPTGPSAVAAPPSLPLPPVASTPGAFDDRK